MDENQHLKFKVEPCDDWDVENSLFQNRVKREIFDDAIEEKVTPESGNQDRGSDEDQTTKEEYEIEFYADPVAEDSSESGKTSGAEKSDEEAIGPYLCKDCGMSFAHKASRFRHQYTVHTIPHKCEDSFLQKENVVHKSSETGDKTQKKHKICQTGEEKHECEQCGKFFARSGNLARHKRIHTGQKPYTCKICQKRFALKAYLRNHTSCRNEKKTFHCVKCGEGFKAKGVLVQHMSCHTAECTECGNGLIHDSREKPYECEHCKMIFLRMCCLVKHMGGHNDSVPKNRKSVENPHECEYCGESFGQMGDLLVHKREHSGDRPHQCDVCKRRFARIDHFIKHREMHVKTGE